MQLDQGRVQAVLRKDEERGNQPQRQAEGEGGLCEINEIREGLADEQLQEPRAKAQLRDQQQPQQTSAVPVLPAARLRYQLRRRVACGRGTWQVPQRKGQDHQGPAGSH